MRRTLGVCDLTLPARASDPWTLPMIAVEVEVDQVDASEALCGES